MAPPLHAITNTLNAELAQLRFGAPVTHVYNPLTYARPAWDQYCQQFAQGERKILLLGMNPGPFGMAQVGVPFGEVAMARDWLGISAPIGQPERVHPKRPIQGFDCPRSEVSGQRFWGWARDTFGTPERFFAQFFVTNYCPLCFMVESGANLTPDKLRADEREALFATCDRALAATITQFQPMLVIGVGHFAEARLRAVVGTNPQIHVGRVPHPSPASPLANAGWAPLMTRALHDLGVTLP
jgi:single-strand selective monofunctional uracil DNA glycosylase